nr:MAG TPA: hypothetical protein [Caudoviricetes sp.]
MNSSYIFLLIMLLYKNIVNLFIQLSSFLILKKF